MALDLFPFGLVFLYFFLGAIVKFIDSAFDEGVFGKGKALLIALPTGLLWGYAMYLSEASSVILLSIVIASLLAGKLDNGALLLGIIGIITAVVFFGYLDLVWLVLAGLVFAGFLDEVGNDYADKHLFGSKNILSGAANYFFRHRFAMKLAVLFFAVTGFFGFIYFLAFLAWDLGYELVARYSLWVKSSGANPLGNPF